MQKNMRNPMKKHTTKAQRSFFFALSVYNTNLSTKQTKWLYTWFVFVFLTLMPWTASAWYKTKIKAAGYVESRYTAMLGLDLGSLCKGDLKNPLKQMCNPHILVNRIRPTALVRLSRELRLRVTGNVQLSHFRLEREIKKIEDVLTVPRLYLELRLNRITIRAGKQSFNWGPAQLWSLTTPFVPQDPTDLNAELPGLWAVSAQASYAAMGFFRMGVLASPDFRYTLEFLRWKHTFGNTDVAVTVVEGGLNRELVIGAEVKGTLGVGFWLESAVRIPYQSMLNDKDPKETSFSFVVGVDYSFPVLENMIISLQYYYNHAGIGDPKKYPFNTIEGLAKLGEQLRQTSQSNNITGIGLSSGGFIGKHYIMLNVQLKIFEELSASLMAVSNIIDPSVMLGPFVGWTFLENFQLTVGAYFFLGPQGSEFAIGKIKLPLPNTPADGVQLSPKAALFAWLRYSF